MTSTPEEALTRKKSVRAAHRSSATRLMNQADALIGATPTNADELALLQANLSTKLTTLEALNVDIVDLTPAAQLEEEIGRADEYSEKIRRTLLLIRKELKTPPSTGDPPRDPTTRDPDPTPATPSVPDPSHAGAVAGSKVNLPKISLPHFKGNPLYWTAF